jgi:hypothetical protein
MGKTRRRQLKDEDGFRKLKSSKSSKNKRRDNKRKRREEKISLNKIVRFQHRVPNQLHASMYMHDEE